MCKLEGEENGKNKVRLLKKESICGGLFEINLSIFFFFFLKLRSSLATEAHAGSQVRSPDLPSLIPPSLTPWLS